MNYVNILNDISRLPFMRTKRKEFTKFVSDQFVAEAAAKCLEIKTKYKVRGKLSYEKAIEIVYSEGGVIDCLPENKVDERDFYFSKLSDGKLLIWIEDTNKLEEGQQKIIFGLSSMLLPNHLEALFSGTPVNATTEDEVIKHPDLLKYFIATDTLAALLRSNETRAELKALMQIQPSNAKSNKPVLDLSAHPEHLNVTAEQFSKVVNNPNLPKDFKKVLDTYCEVKQ